MASDDSACSLDDSNMNPKTTLNMIAENISEIRFDNDNVLLANDLATGFLLPTCLSRRGSSCVVPAMFIVSFLNYHVKQSLT